MYFKVVTENLMSLGLRKNPNLMYFPVDEWVIEPEPMKGNSDYGGIWCTATLSNAKKLQKYFEKYGKSRIFVCEIGEVLYQNSYRVKTNKVKLIEEMEDERIEDKKRRNPEFREEDLEQGEVVNDSQFGKVVHVGAFHSIAPDGTHIYEF